MKTLFRTPYILFFALALSGIYACATEANNDGPEQSQQLQDEQARAALVKAEKKNLEAERIAKAKADSLARVKAELEEKRAEEERLAEARRKKEEAERKRKAQQRKKQQARKKPEPKPAPKQPSQPAATGARIAFANKTYNFGTINEGELVKHVFKYKNTGSDDLIIMDASASCGCTAPGFNFLPLKPGLDSEINVTFNSKGKVGPQRATVTILTNGIPQKEVLTLEGVVTTPKKEEKEDDKTEDKTEQAETPSEDAQPAADTTQTETE